MEQAEKHDCIDTLFESAKSHILNNLDVNEDKIKEWDGHELRQYVADYFESCTHPKMSAPRKRAYNNTVRITTL